MKTPSWNNIRNELANQKPDASASDAESFWSDFKAKASLVNQDQTATETRPVILRPFTLAAACAAALAIAVGLTLFAPVTAEAGLNQINSVEISAPHSAVMIMTDEQTESTILWIADMGGNVQNRDQS